MDKGPRSEGHLSARESTAMGESGPPGNGVQKAKGEGETLHPTILAGRGGKGRGGEGRGRVVGRGVGTAKSDERWVTRRRAGKQKGGNNEKKGLYRGARQTDPCV